jgi:hypothetical protein
MGCHTWFHKKVKGFTREEAIQKVVEAYEKEMGFIERLINDRESFDQDLLEAYPEWTPEWAESQKPTLTETLEMLKSGEFTDDWIFSKSMELSMDVGYYLEGRGFYKSTDELPHDLFRIYGYPDDMLFSLQETLDYAEGKCEISEFGMEKLKEFWINHPDGMIEFG